MAETLYKASNTPVQIASTVIPRAQSFQINRDRQTDAEFELGNYNSSGTSVGSWMYDGTLTFNPIGTLVERAVVGQTASANYVVKLADLISAAAVAVTTPKAGLTGAFVTGVEYNVAVPNGKWTCTMNFKATGKSGTTTVSAPAVAGVGSYRAKNIYARFDTLAETMLRLKSIRFRAGFTAEDLYQLSSEDPFSQDKTQPTVTVDLEWYGVVESVNPGTNAVDLRPILEEASGTDLEVQVLPSGAAWDDADNIRVMLYNLTTNREGEGVEVGQQASHSISYTSGGDSTTYGWSVDVIGV